MNYSWQESYLSALHETDELKQRTHILGARAAFEQRLLSPVGDEELGALGIAAAALDALERKRPNIAQRISDIHTAGNPRASDMDV